jgi:hypothetical protein
MQTDPRPGLTRPPELYKRRWFWAAFALIGLACIAALGRLVPVAIEAVAAGKGLDTYDTFWLIELNYIGIVVIFGAVVLTMLVGGGLWLHDRSEKRAEKKVEQSRGNT